MISCLLSACVHKINVIQGNFLDDEVIAKLNEGMTRQQVRFVLGDPVLEDSFSKDTWEYVYYVKIGRNRDVRQERLTVHFSDNKVVRLQRHDMSAQASLN